jgi:hypothetical protein
VDVAGLDFCFGLAEEHMRRLGLPMHGPAAVGRELRRRFADDADAFKFAVGNELARETDRDRRSPFRPTNMRMYRQTFWGLRALSGVERPTPPWSHGDGAVVEILPVDVARKLLVPAKATREGRCDALAALERHGIALSRDDRVKISDDVFGDGLDAVFAAVAAASARADGLRGASAESASSGEGWIYSIA